MKKLLLAACVVLAVGCTKKTEEVTEAPAAPAPAAAPVAAPAPTAAPAKVEEPKKIEITDDLMKKYVAFTKENLRLVTAFAEERAKAQRELKKDDTAAALKELKNTDEASKKLEADVEKAREAAGLSKDELEQVRAVCDDVVAARMLFTQAGGEKQIAELEKSFKAQLANVPADKRAEAEAQLGKMTERFKAMKNADDAREEHGDAAVDLVLKYADELTQLKLDAMKAAFGKK